jgi:hypothetical protein
MTTPDTTPAPADPATSAADETRTDTELAARCATSGEWLAGIIAAGMLDTLARPAQLPGDLFPHIPEEHVTAVWNRALAVGLRAAQLAQAPRFNRDTLARLQGVLAEVGHAAMAGLVAQTVRAVPPAPEHPADTEIARGEHW